MSKLGDSFTLYALPRVHAKLYLSPTSSWLGSSNFTRNGFSGIGELILRFTPPSQELRNTFDTFKSKATRVTEGNMQFLIDAVRAGLTRLSPDLDVGKVSGDVSIDDTLSYEDFKTWLGGRGNDEDATYIIERIDNKNRMSGHSYSGFNGTFSFLGKNRAIGKQLLKLHGRPIPENTLARLSHFVSDYGDRFGGPRGGTWRSKLSVRLGGIQTSGGAGDTLVKRLLVEVAKYMNSKGFL